MTKSPRLSQTSIHKFFASLPDPRRRRRRVKHPLLNLVVIAICGTIAGADDWEEIVQFARDRREWLSRFLDLSKGVPSHDTFGRVFAKLDPVAFQKCLLAWVQRLHELTQGQVIAIDGKVAREAMARAGDQGPMTLVSAWATANHICLGQVAGETGSNELGALPKLLDLLNLDGAIVTLDALGCQKEIVVKIVDKGGDYGAKNPPSQADQFFDRLDLNGDGFITPDEIRERLRPLIAASGLTPSEKISLEEFTKMMNEMRGRFSRKDRTPKKDEEKKSDPPHNDEK
jgi:DDE_Tnp_1-associated/EF hand